MSLCTDRGNRILEDTPCTRVRQHLQSTRGVLAPRLATAALAADLGTLEARLRRVRERLPALAGVEFGPELAALVAARTRAGMASRVCAPEGV